MSDITPDFPAVVNDSGLGQDGTVLDAALFAAIKTSINNQVFSATNPAVTPKGIIDEVVTARGSLGSLDTRLSVSLNADGTLKTQASLITAAQAKALLASRNVAQNGDLADWTNGPAAAPDSFVLSGAAAAIAQTGPAMGDVFTFGAGKYAAKLTRVGNDVKLTQTVIAAVDFADYADAKGMKVSAAMRGKTAIANHLRITIDDGATQDSSGYHSGGGAAEVVKFDGHVISNAATKLEIYAEVKASNGDAYVGGFQVVFFEFAPSDWMPLSLVGDASATSKGLVSLAAQVMGAGVKSFGAPMLFKAGGISTFDAVVNGLLAPSVNVTPVNNGASAAEVDLMSYANPAALMSADKKITKITSIGTLTSSVNTKRMKAKYGATTILDTGAINGDSTPYNWMIEVWIIRTGAATEIVFARFSAWNATTGAFVSAGASSWGPVAVAAAETEANSITFKITGQCSAAANNIQQTAQWQETVG